MASIKNPGVKPEVHVDIEQIRHCETLADGTLVEFIRIFRYEDGVLVLPPTDVSLDGATPYVVVDEANVKKCEIPAEDQCFMVKKWLYEQGSSPVGVTEKLWEWDRTTSTGFGVNDTGSAVNTLPIDSVFDTKDACGLPVHPNDADAIVSIIPQAIPTDNGSAQVSNQNELDFWLCIDQPGVSVNARVNGFSSWSVYFGGCDEKLQFIDAGVNSTAAGTNFIDVPLGQLGQGFFHVRLYSHDPGTFGKTLLQWDVGNGFEDIPTENLIATRPSANCTDVIYNKTQGKYFNLDGTELDLEANKCFSCDPCKISSGFPAAVQDTSLEVTSRVLCDKALTGEETKFLQHTVYDPAGAVTDVYETTLLDPTVGYEPSGIVRDCEEQCHTEAFWNQTIAVTDAAAVSLDLTGIDGNGEYCAPRCAQVQVLGGQGFYTVHDNAEPSWDGDEVGHLVNDCATIEIGCCGNGMGCIEELERFKIIANEGDTLSLRVTYYRDKL